MSKGIELTLQHHVFLILCFFYHDRVNSFLTEKNHNHQSNNGESICHCLPPCSQSVTCKACRTRSVQLMLLLMLPSRSKHIKIITIGYVMLAMDFEHDVVTCADLHLVCKSALLCDSPINHRRKILSIRHGDLLHPPSNTDSPNTICLHTYNMYKLNRFPFWCSN